MRSFCGPHAAPSIVSGGEPGSLTVHALTCAKKPQKSHIKSAHLKLAGSRLSVLDRLHLGQAHF